MKLYPVMLNIEGRLAVIVGGGSVACRKLQDLLEAGAVVRLIAPDVDDEIAAFAAERGGQVEIMHRRYCSGDLAGSALVFSATDDPETNRQVGDDARRAGLFVNTADDLENSSLIIPSVTRRGELIMALSTSGASPAMAARLRRELEAYIPETIGEMLPALAEARNILMTQNSFAGLTSHERGECLTRLVQDDSCLGELYEARHAGTLGDYLRCYLERSKE